MSITRPWRSEVTAQIDKVDEDEFEHAGLVARGGAKRQLSRWKGSGDRFIYGLLQSDSSKPGGQLWRGTVGMSHPGWGPSNGRWVTAGGGDWSARNLLKTIPWWSIASFLLQWTVLVQNLPWPVFGPLGSRVLYNLKIN